ncbi:HlyD family secretion protein [Enhydrobacter sp.]|jgi:membrane fusion protein (multidrug efflux system)|uniref:HlyD family secretion protein n=1 Tax=Enhydrobacter sp. TaxID=1894999 RepID=UPI0026385C58|nr:HlyD family secretion protein [Enhydrobacter sp.]WIM09756.1 MAG: Membrane fusion component of MSF-type tripartite multidrug efflux system [Enhydrobacter sp.]
MPFEAPFLALKTRRSRVRTILLAAGPVVVVLGAIAFYLLGGRYVSTDDAYIQAARVEVSANISARVVEIDVHDNEVVKKGQPMVKLDRRPFEIAVESAEAKLASARLRIATLQAAYAQARAEEKAAEDTLAFEQREFDRQSKLAASGIASRSRLDQATHDLETARQRLAAARQRTASALAELGGKPDAPVDSQPGVRQAQAALDHARLELSYTEIDAPIEGIVTKVEQLQVGDYVNAAAPLFALVSDTDVWVEANFKETDLTYMRPGQGATFDVDAFPGESFTGKVVSLSPGTGSSFSLLPPENASGNWVKVVQRLPVRLSIDGNPNKVPLAAGMSVTVEVDTHHRRSLAFWK